MNDKRTYEQEEQIRRYVQNEMTGAERHAFERKMQKDPFLAEAVEGLLSFSSEDIFADVDQLKHKIQNRRGGNRNYVWYAAASVLLLVVSTLFLLKPEEKSNPIVTENIRKEEVPAPKEIVHEPQKQQKDETVQKQETVPAKELKMIDDELEITDTEPAVNLVATDSKQSLFTPDLAGLKQQKISADKMENLKMATADRQQNAISGIVTDSLGAPLPGVSVVIKGTTKGAITGIDGKYFIPNVPDDTLLVYSFVGMKTQEILSENKTQIDVAMPTEDLALSEVVAVGYGIQRKSELTGSATKIPERKNGKAVPVDGWEAYYNGYLNFELQHPDIGPPDQKVVVRLSFVVDETGKPDSFKILHSTNEKYNQPAIEIIENGPRWLPAVKNSVPESETVKLRLVFPVANQ